MKLKNIILGAIAAACCLFTGCGGESGGNSASRGNLDEVTPKSGDEIAVIEIESFGTIKAKLFRDIAPVGVDNFTKLAESGYYNGLRIHRVMKNFMFQGGAKNDDGEGGEAAVNGGKFGIETNKNARHFYGALCYANSMGENSTQFYIVNNKNPQNLDDMDISSLEAEAAQYKSLASQAKNMGVDIYEKYYTVKEKATRTLIEWLKADASEVKELYMKRGGVPGLDGGYTVFGQVYEGFDVIDAVSAVSVSDNGKGEKSKPDEDMIIKSVTVSKYEG